VFNVALTGGFASGKSTITQCFAELGIDVIDADDFARKLITDPAVLSQVLEYFGHSVLTKENQLNRILLREIIFSDSKARYWLENLLHPLIYKEIKSATRFIQSPYALIVIPLLFEERTSVLLKKKPTSENYIELNRILLVMSEKSLQKERAKTRDHLGESQIEAILAAQIPPNESLNKADDIIYNTSTLNNIRYAIHKFHQFYLSLAQSKLALEESTYFRYYLANRNDS
jgi:dephospho-CoA kinase